MKFLIWFGCFFLNALITMIINSNGIILGGIPTALLFLGCYFLAKFLCKKWDNHKTNKLNKKKNNDKLVECFVETPNAPCELPLPNEAENEEIEQNPESEQHFEPEEIVCKKCGNPLLATQVFCSYCGKKFKPQKQKTQKDKIAIKRIIKKIIIITSICIISILIIALAIFGFMDYQYKMDSYDLSTSPYNLEYGQNTYKYEIKNSDGEVLSDIFYLEDNYYVRVMCIEEFVYVSEKGVYEINGGKLTTQDDKGNKTDYRIYRGCLIEYDRLYDGEFPKKDTFSAEITKDYLDTNETVSFNEDGTYCIKNDVGNYTGKYTRDGCIVEGVSDDISGSHKWLFFEGQITDRFFENIYSAKYGERAKYEFCKYLTTIDKDGVSERNFIRRYEAEHPISLQ